MFSIVVLLSDTPLARTQQVEQELQNLPHLYHLSFINPRIETISLHHCLHPHRFPTIHILTQ